MLFQRINSNLLFALVFALQASDETLHMVLETMHAAVTVGKQNCVIHDLLLAVCFFSFLCSTTIPFSLFILLFWLLI